MKRMYRFFFLLTAVACFAAKAGAQQYDSTKPVKVAVFIPLYIDDVFDGYTFSLGKENIPKNVLPGLEFYNGVSMAIDSLNQEGTKVEISIYDSKQKSQTLAQLFQRPEMSDVGLIIAAITNTSELKTFSDRALAKNIPLISATYPNYVGVSANPFFVLLNSSFQAHLQGLYAHMQKKYAANTIIAINKKGGTEDYIKSVITTLNKNTKAVPLKIKWITVDDASFSIQSLKSSLDSTRNNVVFVASPLESFGLKVAETLSNAEIYPVTLIGMPTWDGIKALNGPTCKNIEIVFSTPFLYYSQNRELSNLINDRYKDKYFSRPSDMVYKGFEITYHFTKLLAKHRYNLINNLTDNDFTLFNRFLLEPVTLKSTSVQPDFLENKKLYFIKKQNGSIVSIM